MFESLTPDQQELLAGYALGELDSEELSQVQELFRQYPVLEGEVLHLQGALGALPLGLEIEEPPAELRSRLMASATPLSTGVRRKSSVPWGRIVGGLAVGVSLLLGWQNWQLRQQLAKQQPDDVAITAEESLPPGQERLAFEEVLADHQNSLVRSQGPVDFATQNVAAVRSKYAQRMVLPTALPQLMKAQLLGGSFCELTQTKGIRLSYQVKTGKTVSFYQLLNSEGFPPATPGEIGAPIQVVQESNTLVSYVWKEQDYIYVLVGDLPLQEMRQLALSI